MSEDATSSRWLRELRSEPSAPRSSEAQAARADFFVARMDQLLQGQPRRARRSPQWLWAAAALVVLAAGAVGVARSHRLAWQAGRAQAPAGRRLGRLQVLSGAVQMGGRSSAEPVAAAPRALQKGDELSVTQGSRATLQLESGALVELSQRAQLTLSATSAGNEALTLGRGRVDLSVPPLKPRSLAVITPNAVVTVVGTQFSVTVEGAKPALRTCVAVQRGRVSVASADTGRLLGPGETWSSDGQACSGAGALSSLAVVEPALSSPGSASEAWVAPATMPAAHGGTAPLRSSVPAARALAAPDASARVTAERQAGSLAEQNRLFAAALRARERGDVDRARHYFAELIERFPDAALGPPARRELQKLAPAPGGSR